MGEKWEEGKGEKGGKGGGRLRRKEGAEGAAGDVIGFRRMRRRGRQSFYCWEDLR